MPVMVDERDAVVIQEDGRTQVEDELGVDSFIVFLKNFPLVKKLPLEGRGLLPGHEAVLRGWVVPYFKRPAGVCEIYAMADRSGDEQTNYRVSAARLLAVQRAMVGYGAPQAKVYHRFAKAIGEDLARHKGVPDGTKNPEHRMVVIGLSPGPIGIPTRFFQGVVAREIISFGRLHQPAGA